MSDRVLSIMRNLLTAVGGFFIGRAFFGITLTGETTDAIIGIILAIAGIVWGIKDKTVTIEMVQSFLRHFASTIGGILVGTGRADYVTIANTIDKVVGLIVILIPLFQGQTTRIKAKQLAIREIHPQQLVGARPNELKVA